MEEIVWFNKEIDTTWKQSDVSVTKLKDGSINIIIRNGWMEEITKTGYMRIGFSAKSKNKLYFMAAEKDKGWKIINPKKGSSKIQLSGTKAVEGCLRFIGDYEMELSDDNLFFIDRKNVLE